MRPITTSKFLLVALCCLLAGCGVPDPSTQMQPSQQEYPYPYPEPMQRNPGPIPDEKAPLATATLIPVVETLEGGGTATEFAGDPSTPVPLPADAPKYRLTPLPTTDLRSITPEPTPNLTQPTYLGSTVIFTFTRGTNSGSPIVVELHIGHQLQIGPPLVGVEGQWRLEYDAKLLEIVSPIVPAEKSPWRWKALAPGKTTLDVVFEPACQLGGDVCRPSQNFDTIPIVILP